MELSPQPVPGKETSVFHRSGRTSNCCMRLSVTDRCNFRCQYCRPARQLAMNHCRHPPQCGLVDLVRRIDQCALCKAPIDGRRGGCVLVWSILVKPPCALAQRSAGVDTNGSMLSRLAGPLRMAGLDALNINSTPWTRLPSPRFLTAVSGRVLEGIRAAQAEGFGKLKLNSVLIRRVNGDHLSSLVRLAVDVGCEIRFIRLMPCGPGATLFATDFLSANGHGLPWNEFAYLGIWMEMEQLAGIASPSRATRDDRFHHSVSHPFCATCNRLRLDCRGRLVSCVRTSKTC